MDMNSWASRWTMTSKITEDSGLTTCRHKAHIGTCLFMQVIQIIRNRLLEVEVLPFASHLKAGTKMWDDEPDGQRALVESV